jgi:hypothetical protein
MTLPPDTWTPFAVRVVRLVFFILMARCRYIARASDLANALGDNTWTIGVVVGDGEVIKSWEAQS